ncbi:MAG: hypothetical protein R3231_06355 [bacterium]|nr:hypothetical protein [bacterium]
MKITYRAGETVSKGNYWNVANGARIQCSGESVLLGDRETTYVKAHPIVVLMAAPLLGLMYAGFLPFIGIAMVLKVVGMKLADAVGAHLTPVAGFRWNPSEAYLSGKKRGGKKKAEKTKEGVETRKEDVEDQ